MIVYVRCIQTLYAAHTHIFYARHPTVLYSSSSDPQHNITYGLTTNKTMFDKALWIISIAEFKADSAAHNGIFYARHPAPLQSSLSDSERSIT